MQMRHDSIYKQEVVASLNEYKRTINGRIFGDTDPSRIRVCQKIVNDLSKADIIFLWNTLNETLAIDDVNSKLRDKTGRKALSQLYKYVASAVELLALLDAGINLVYGENSAALKYLLTCYLTDQLENVLQNTLKNKKLFIGILDSINLVKNITVKEVVHCVNSMSLQKVGASAMNICKNVRDVSYSNFCFFKHKLTGDAAGCVPGFKR